MTVTPFVSGCGRQCGSPSVPDPQNDLAAWVLPLGELVGLPSLIQWERPLDDDAKLATLDESGELTEHSPVGSDDEEVTARVPIRDGARGRCDRDDPAIDGEERPGPLEDVAADGV